MFDLVGRFAPTASISYNVSSHYLYAANTSFSKVNSNRLTIARDTVFLLYASSQPPSTLLCPDKGGKKSADMNWSLADSIPGLVAFPNPGNEWVELVVPVTTTAAELSVFNPQGEQIFSEYIPAGTQRKQRSITGRVGVY